MKIQSTRCRVARVQGRRDKLLKKAQSFGRAQLCTDSSIPLKERRG